MKFSLDLNRHIYSRCVTHLRKGSICLDNKMLQLHSLSYCSLSLGKELFSFLDWFQDRSEFLCRFVFGGFGFFSLLSFLIAVFLLLLNFPFTTMNCLFILRLWDNGVWSTPPSRKCNYLWPRSTWSLKDAAIVTPNKLI